MTGLTKTIDPTWQADGRILVDSDEANVELLSSSDLMDRASTQRESIKSLKAYADRLAGMTPAEVDSIFGELLSKWNAPEAEGVSPVGNGDGA